ncbi:MAG: heparinase II/III family protein [Erythrobacter sp.]|uniref:heparinase II/III family protein n=1 Tax=Erythrobacter sp. TaxID=1042 RepID=UPI0026189FF3|nr:heparinase II/III family protein [Erythrobacter sp.]MDJ0979592.1 heparinase II/III family protein [Erythrobacter sp.]
MDTLFRDEASEVAERREDEGPADSSTGEARAHTARDPLASEASESSRALALSDVIAPRSGPGEALIRLAYRLGVPGHALAAPFRRASAPRLRAQVRTPIAGDRSAGTALRAGHFLVDSVKLPIAQVDFTGQTRVAPGVERSLHSFGWLYDLAASAPREMCTDVAERIAREWLHANGQCPLRAAKAGAWSIENTGLRLMAWLVHAPLIMGASDSSLRSELLDSVVETAGWLDRKVLKTGAGLGQMIGWAAVTAAGLLLPEGKPRRLYGQAALVKCLGDLVAEDGGLLARCPAAQMQAIATLTDLIACYEAVEEQPPEALFVMRELLVPPLLALRHGDGALGSWQGQGAISADRVASLIAATGVRTRPLNEPEHWGFQRLRGGNTQVQFDAAPPPRARHARMGCASTLAFEMSDGPARLVVNCGGASLAGGQVPAHIGQGLRATAAHSTLVLDNANSTAVLLHGKLGKGAENVEVERRAISKQVTRVDASHDGYVARFGLTHQRILSLRSDGSQLAGEDILIPAGRKGVRGKVGFAIRFHLGRGVEAQLSQDKRGASLLTRDGRLWQFRLRGDAASAGEVALAVEDSLWVDGEGRPHPTQQLVIEGLTSRGGGQFSWLFKKTS